MLSSFLINATPSFYWVYGTTMVVMLNNWVDKRNIDLIQTISKFVDVGFIADIWSNEYKS